MDMDNIPFDAPTWIDFLQQRAEQFHEQRRRGLNAAGGAPSYPVLVRRDRLFFRVSGCDSPAEAAAAEEGFRSAFLTTWRRIPEPDRRALLCYWRSDPARLPTAGPGPALYPRPRIRVLHDPTSSPSDHVCDKLGTELTFPLDLVVEHPHQLPSAIARALAVAHRFATCRHWALILAKIEDPLARWEKRAGKKADDASRDTKIDRLEAAHLRAYEKEVAALLRGWGFDPSARAAR